MSDTTPNTIEARRTSAAPITFELALYRVRDADAFAGRQHELHAAARGFDGYLGSWPLRADGTSELSEASEASETSDVFADLVQWRDGEAARAAAEQFGQRPDLAWVSEAMTEMLFFGHLHTHDGHPTASTGPIAATGPT